jgi:hypothetical protein
MKPVDAMPFSWPALQVIGAYLVHHFLHSDSVYGVFATVLGLVAWLYLAAEITVYCAEVNVVLARRLWPRSIVQPPLTEADRASLALQALQNQLRKEQQVTVTFMDREPGTSASPTTPRTPADISPPAQRTPPPQELAAAPRTSETTAEPRAVGEADERQGTGT